MFGDPVVDGIRGVMTGYRSFVQTRLGDGREPKFAPSNHMCAVAPQCRNANLMEMTRRGFLDFFQGLFLPIARALDTEPPTFFPPADRIIAVGDVHGDVKALKAALRLARIIGNSDEWVGGSSVLVQVGDLLDRGDQERAALDLLLRLKEESRTAGGAVHVLQGNHEIMNVSLDFRYVTPGGFKDFDNGETVEKAGKLPNAVSEVAIVIGDNVFVHGGLRPTHLADPGALESMNTSCRQWMQGRGEKPSILKTGKSPVWMRHYSLGMPKLGSDECSVLQATLDLIPAKRMIVGHTPQQKGINAVCGGKVWRVDTGMSSAYGGPVEALEITSKRIRVLTAKGWRSAYSRTSS